MLIESRRQSSRCQALTVGAIVIFDEGVGIYKTFGECGESKNKDDKKKVDASWYAISGCFF